MSAGETATVLLLGADRKQASILRRYCEGLLQAPLLAAEVSRLTDDAIEFRNGGQLEIGTNDVRLVRGRSAVAVLGSETCYWRVDEMSASSDEEVVAAATPSLAMCPRRFTAPRGGHRRTVPPESRCAGRRRDTTSKLLFRIELTVTETKERAPISKGQTAPRERSHSS